MKVQTIVAYEDGRLDAQFSDKAYAILHGDSLTYFTPSGIQSIAKIKSISNIDSLFERMRLISAVYNKYSDNFFNLESDSTEELTKLKKITGYQWPSQHNPMISEIAQGWKIHSLDGNAQVTLHRDLFKITVSYLQDTSQKIIETVKFEYNSKNLLQKYRLPYQDYTNESQKAVVMHKYQRVLKQFCIWNIPQRWKYPCGLIWKNVEVAEEPLFIPDIMAQGKTLMPETAFRDEAEAVTLSLMPSIRHPKHRSKAIWLWTDGSICWFRKEGALLNDGQLYWQCQGDNLHIKLFNTIMSEKIYHIKAIPLVVRLKNYEGYMLDCLKLVHTYNFHNNQNSLQYNLRISTQQPHESRQFVQIHQHSDQFAHYAAYANKIVRAKFIDRTLITFSEQNIRVITPEGQTLNINRNNLEFHDHLELVIRYFQEIFHPEQCQMRQQLSMRLQAEILANKLRIDIINSVCK